MTKALRTILLGLFLGALVVVTGCAAVEESKSPPGTTTTVIVLRHAERTTFGTELIAAGRARAAALPAAVADYGIAAIYSPDKVRNLDTVRPLAKQRELKIRVVNEWDAADHMLSENPGKVVLWVGNTDNLQHLYKVLAATGGPPLNYGDLFVLTVRDGKTTKVIKSRYGK